MFRLALRLFTYACVMALFFFVSLELMDYFDLSPGSNCSGTSCCPTGQTLALSPPLPQLEGYAYKASVPQLNDLGDIAAAARSPTIICEDDHRMGPAHIPYAEVIEKGRG